MIILLTNDDGFRAEGINALFDALSGSHEVYMIAPDRERSACSNAFTIGREKVLKKTAPGRYSLSGYPADCVALGVQGGIIPRPELVISGINHGPNLGDDTVFSGTVAGARSAHIFGVPGIAVSINSYHRVSGFFGEASAFVLGFIAGIPDLYSNDFFLNINYPDLPSGEIRGFKYTRLGKRIYRDSYRKVSDSGDEITVSLDGEIRSLTIEGSDVTEMEKGYISVTPMMIDSTDYSALEKLKGE